MPIVSTVRGSFGAQGRFGKVKLFATGGTITTSGGYRIHTFTLAESATNFTPNTTETVEYLVVAGGAGGSQQHSGGGGAGGMRTGSLQVTGGNAISVIVGAGGALQPNTGGCSYHSTPAGNGGSSTFSTITSIGGGYPGCYNTFVPFAGPNGSGGGGRNTTVPQDGAPGTAGQGYAGGASDYNHVGGGGGGAGEVGRSGASKVSNQSARSGGNGLESSISGTATYYAGGGGGGSHNIAMNMDGGLGGGARGGRAPSAGGDIIATAAVDGTGGGGGGNGGCEPNHPGFPPTRGGHGIVIIRYPV